ncbi:MAG: PEP-CTERM sorting domain-containing protein [Microcystis sp. M_OC_Ca_00000000_S217Cul]|uniref:PEP-CTERM sorting domain-containing protein n=1 Tax=unclassified Microcystis TaxID=2643300 RepID=UPI00118F6A28|nr:MULTISPECIES: PEP-CTERM sorting domain-containing protein [unclassified Microcystis]TRT73676.1 MAG: PEP-CTERM sorting domain-containing protein [Microcystis sp. M_OC_Ca_00000000_S217Cul]TRT85262.1 MAG: PEP-CTERM sorting domain-containing protein [Microcystis sp. M_OC_Ca_00000000_C217Col]
MNKILANCISLGIGLGAIGVAVPVQAAPFFTGLGFLPGSVESYARGVSADGSVVVGFSNGANGQEAFRWTQATGMVGLGDLSGGITRSSAFGVSADGSVVVGRGFSSSGEEAFRWTQGTGMVGLGDLSGGITRSRAFGVSADGSVVVGESNSANGGEAFRWTQGTGMVGLGYLSGGGAVSEAYGVSGDGSVVVGRSANANFVEAFRWTQGTGMVGLGDLSGGGFSSVPHGVSGDGSVIVGHGDEAFIWNSSQGMQSLKQVLTNDYGLNLAGWTLISAQAISADGLTVVGTGTNPSGNDEAWIARLNPQNNPSVPEPSSILGLGLFSLVGFLRKKRS